MPEIGGIYEKHVIVESGYRLERRLVLDVNEIQVLYEIVLDPPEGTHVESENVRKQVSIKDWRLWSQNTRVKRSRVF